MAEITEQDYVGYREPLPLSQLANQTTFEMFEHNIETGAYEVRNVQIMGSEGPVDKLALTFKDGVLIQLEMADGEEKGIIYFTYDNISLTLPELYSE